MVASVLALLPFLWSSIHFTSIYPLPLPTLKTFLAAEMENDGPRRSGRARAAVKTFQSEQEQAALVAPVRKKAVKSRVKSERTADTPVKDEPDDTVESAEPLAVDSRSVKAEAESEGKPTKKRPRATEPDEFKAEDDSELEVQEKPKKKKRAKKSATATGQLYGAPPVGTIIP